MTVAELRAEAIANGTQLVTVNPSGLNASQFKIHGEEYQLQSGDTFEFKNGKGQTFVSSWGPDDQPTDPVPTSTAQQVNPNSSAPKVTNADVQQATDAAVKAGADPAALAAARAKLGTTAYIGLCESFVESVNGMGNMGSSAINAWNGAPQLQRTDLQNIRPGDTIYFAPTADNQYGHTGIYSGNGNFISATNNGIQEVPIGQWQQQTGQKALGYFSSDGRTVPSTPNKPAPTTHVSGSTTYQYDPASGTWAPAAGIPSDVLGDQLKRLQIQEAQQALTPKVQQLFEQQAQTINSIGQALAAGQISMSEANQRYAATKSYTDAAVQGTTPFAIYERQLADEQARATQAQSLITNELSQGESMTKALLDAVGPAATSKLTVLPNVPFDWNNLLSASKQSVDTFVPPQLSQQAADILSSFYGGTPPLPNYGSAQIANGGQQDNTAPVPGLDPNLVAQLSPAVQKALQDTNNGRNQPPPQVPAPAPPMNEPQPYNTDVVPNLLGGNPDMAGNLLGGNFDPNQMVPYPADAQPVG